MYLQPFFTCQASHGHQVQANRSNDRLAGVVEPPYRMHHFASEASKRYFNFDSSSCHQLSPAPRGLQRLPGTAVAVICSVRIYGARESFGIIGGMVAVNPVALQHARR